LLTEGNWNVLWTAYGQLFVLKLLGFQGLLGLAALNKLALTPALLRNDPKAYGRLRLSISIEMFFCSPDFRDYRKANHRRVGVKTLYVIA
jgi:putative copper export protein